jgi:integrase
LARLGLPKIRLHGLRHTHATLLLAAGWNVKTVSARLGHALVAFTLDTYAGALPELEEDAATAVARLVRARLTATETATQRPVAGRYGTTRTA